MFKSIASLFVDVEEPKKPVKRESSPPPPPAHQTPLPIPSPSSTIGSIGQFDPDIAKILKDAVEAANLPGYDYLEFRQVLSGMEHIPMTEQQKFQAAYAAAQAMKVSKQELIKAAQFYLTILDKKKDEFVAVVEDMTKNQVVSKETEVSKLEKNIQEDAEEIQKLTNEIKEARQKQAALTQEIDVERSKIQQKAAAFETTFNVIYEGIKVDSQKIEALIPE